jgi:cytochrome P450 family 135
LLLLARNEEGAPLSDGELRDELVTLLVAGHETSAAALSWALTELAREPEAQRRLADGEQGLAEAAVTETLRLHPPLPIGALRRLRQPMSIGDWRLPTARPWRPAPSSSTGVPMSIRNRERGGSTASWARVRPPGPGCRSVAV